MEIRFGDEGTGTHSEIVRVLDQDFVMPEDVHPVRMQVGKMPLTIVGWIANPESLPFLLRAIADANEIALEEWNAATPEDRGESAEGDEDEE